VKVALVHHRQSGTGGTERYLNQIAVHLAARGDEVTIVCRKHEEAPHPAVRFAVLPSLTIGAAWRMWAFARAVEQHVRAADYDLVFGLGKTWTHDIVRLGGGCHQTYLDAAHAHQRPAWQQRCGGWTVKDQLALAIEARSLKPGAYWHVITNSEMVKRDAMQRHAIPAEMVTVIYNGVDLDRFHPRLRGERGAALRHACGFSEDDCVVLFLGTGYRRKGLRRILDVFPDLLHQRPHARLLVVGYDSARPAFERMATALGVASQVRFLGGRRDPEACFAAADVYALPTSYDPFASSTLEALASGLPVITTDSNGASELLTAGETGSVLAGSAAPGAMLESLLVWTARARARTAASAARALAERYPQEDTARRSAEVLDQVRIAKPRRAWG
jgi:UDP-glucose:(heptosyl)LPS alpha-1,3-glucosyltransferase